MLLSLGLVAVAMAGIGRSRADFSHKGYFWDNDPYLQQFEAFERRFGNDDTIVVAVHSPSGVFDLDSATLLRQLTDRLWKVPEVIRVDSLANYNWVHASGDDIIVEPLLPEHLTADVLQQRRRVALGHEILPGYLVSRDARTALLFARVKPGIDKPSDAQGITRALEKLAQEFSRTDHVIHLSGDAPLNNAFSEVATRDTGRLLPLALLIAAVFLALILRSVAGVIIPLGVVLLSIAASFGFAGWVGITLTNMSTVIPSIMIAVAIADCVHLLVAYQDARRQARPGQDALTARESRGQAARYALEKNLLPTFLTSTTTAIGFITFASADLKPLSGMGFMAAFGVMFAWVMSYLLLGGLLFLLPLRVRPVRTRVKAGAVAGQSRAERWSARYTALLLRNRRWVVLVTALVAVVSLGAAVSNEVNSDPVKYFRDHVPVRIANEFIEAQVGGARAVELVVDSGREDGVKDPVFLAKTEALQRWIEQQPGVSRALSIVDILKQTNRALNGENPAAYRIPTDRETVGQELFLYSMNLPQGMDLNDRVTLNNDALRMTVLTRIGTSRELVAAVERIEAHGRALGLKVHATGKFTLWQRLNGYVVTSFTSSFGTSVLLIGLMMVVFLRSLRLGIIAMIPNVLPILFGFGFLRLIGQPLDMGTVLVASVCLGIAVDDTIHVLANFQRLRRQGRSERQAVTEVFAHTAPALLSTTAILVISFASFALADFTPNIYFGVLTALILATALLVDMTITPLLLVRTGKNAESAESEKSEKSEKPAGAQPAEAMVA